MLGTTRQRTTVLQERKGLGHALGGTTQGMIPVRHMHLFEIRLDNNSEEE